jgi:hypothetical protein
MSMTRCSRCQGFVPPRSLRCPNCAASRSARGLLSRVGLAGGVLGGGAVAFTLMACYGMPPCDDANANGCGYVPPTEDAGGDAGDAGGDAAQADAGRDSAVDAASDGGADAAVDASRDGGNDSGADAASQDSGDAGTGDSGDAGTPSDAGLADADAAG